MFAKSMKLASFRNSIKSNNKKDGAKCSKYPDLIIIEMANHKMISLMLYHHNYYSTQILWFAQNITKL